MASKEYLFRAAKAHHPSFEASTSIKDLTNDKKIGQNVLALHTVRPLGWVAEVFESMLNPSSFKHLRKQEKFFPFFAKSLVTKDARIAPIVSRLKEGLAAWNSGKDAKEVPALVCLLARCLSCDADGDKEALTNALADILKETFRRYKTAKKESKAKRNKALLCLLLSTLRLVAQDAHADLSQVEGEVLQCLASPDRELAGRAIAVCEAIIGRGDQGDEPILSKYQKTLEKAHEDTLRDLQSPDFTTSNFRTDLCRLLGHCLQAHYANEGAGEGTEEAAQAYRNLLVLMALNRKDVQTLLEATKQLACDICVCDLDDFGAGDEEEAVAREIAAIREACTRSWAYLISAEADALATIISSLKSLLDSAERDLQHATIGTTVLTLFKCAHLGRSGGESSLLPSLVSAVRAAVNRTTSLNLFFMLSKCMLWGSGLGAELDVITTEVEARLAEGSEHKAPAFLILDLMTEFLTYFKLAARDDQASDILLLLTALAQKTAVVEAQNHLEAAWKACMRRSGVAKAAAVASALGILSLQDPPPSSLETEQARAMKTKSVEFLTEYLNFAFAEYQWKPNSTDLAETKDFGRPLGFHGVATQRESLMARALMVFQESLDALAWDRSLQRKIVRALVTVGIRSSAPFQRRCLVILERASAACAGAMRSAVAQAVQVLSELERARELFEAKVGALGENLQEWSEDERQAVRALHAEMIEKVNAVCFIPKQLYLPLGIRSQALVSS